MLLKISLVTFLGLFVTSCANVALLDEPIVRPKLYAGSHHEGAIVRAKSKEVIQCTDKKINDYVCLSYPDLLNIQHLIDECRKIYSK